MATNAMKTPLVRIAARGFAAQAAPASWSSAAPTVTTAPNKVTVAAQDNGGALSRVSIVFRTGSRNETPENRGAAAVVRSSVGLATQKFTQFGIIRNIQQAGASISATGDRETTSFTLVATRDQVESLLPYLAQVACSPAFKPWELSDNLPLLKYQMSLLTPQIRVVDILHKAAYRTGLGNSIFVKKDFLGKQDSESLKHFVAKGFTANRCAVAGVNVDPSILQELAICLPLSSGEPSTQGSSTYLGGEVRKDKYGDSAQVAVAAEGAGWTKDIKSAAALYVLQYALGVAPSVKWGAGASPIARAVAQAAGGNAGASAINAVEAAVGVLRSGNVSDADVARGKAQLKAQQLELFDNSGELLHEIGLQAALTGSVLSASAIVDIIDKVSASDVKAVAKKIASSKLSLAGFGNLNNVPYLDQLK